MRYVCVFSGNDEPKTQTVNNNDAASAPSISTPQQVLPPPNVTVLPNVPLNAMPHPHSGPATPTAPPPSSGQLIPPSQPQPQTQSMGMESHFMQQQSQVFVFSTQLANKAAEGVLSGQYKSVIAYHIDQPGTKQILQVRT